MPCFNVKKNETIVKTTTKERHARYYILILDPNIMEVKWTFKQRSVKLSSLITHKFVLTLIEHDLNIMDVR